MSKLAIIILVGVFVVLGLVVFSTTTYVIEPKSLDPLNLHFFDVGEGDCILIDYGSYEAVIDSGDGDTDIVDLVDPYIDGDIELVVATHPHADHIGGFPALFRWYKVDTYWHTDYSLPTQAYSELETVVASENCFSYMPRENDAIQIGDDLRISVIETGDHYYNTNDSIVLQIDYGDTSSLLMGDTEAEGEKALLAQFEDIDVLKIGHHASCGSTTQEFLDIVKPEIAIYSCGIDNSYSFPCWATLDRLEGIDIYGTDVNGSITASSNGNRVKIATEKT